MFHHLWGGLLTPPCLGLGQQQWEKGMQSPGGGLTVPAWGPPQVLALCHIAVGQQMNLHWLHKVRAPAWSWDGERSGVDMDASTLSWSPAVTVMCLIVVGQACASSLSPPSNLTDVGDCDHPILQSERLTYREVKDLARGFPVQVWKVQDSSSGRWQ